MAKDGVTVSQEPIRHWCRKFGQPFAAELRRHQAPPADQRHCNEVQLKVNGQVYYLWRPIERHGIELGILEQERRNKDAACTFLRDLLYSVTIRRSGVKSQYQETPSGRTSC